MSKWRKRPVVIDAMQIPDVGGTVDELIEWSKEVMACRENNHGRMIDAYVDRGGAPRVRVESLEGDLQGQYPDWLVIGTRSEPYIVAGAIFPEIYEPAEAE